MKPSTNSGASSPTVPTQIIEIWALAALVNLADRSQVKNDLAFGFRGGEHRHRHRIMRCMGFVGEFGDHIVKAVR